MPVQPRLAFARARTAGMRQTPCTLLRNEATPDGWGGSVPAWTDVTPAGGLLCRVSPDRTAGRELVAEGGEEAVDYFLIAFDPDIDQPPVSLMPADRIAALGQTFEIIELGPSSYEVEHTCRCVRLR